MFGISDNTTKTLQIALVCGALAAALPAPAPASAPADAVCARAVGLSLDSLDRSFAGAAGETPCFTVRVPEAGFLQFEAVVPAGSGVEPRVELLGRACAEGRAGKGRFTYLERRASGLLAAVWGPGEVVACVSAQDPSQALGEFKVASGFVPGLPVAARDPEEDEPDPQPIVVFDPDGGTGGDGFGESSPVLPMPAAARDPEEDEPDPQPMVFPAGGFDALCAGSLEDDHGDTLGCATGLTLDSETSAEIANLPGDDEDVFLFEVTEFETVRVTTSGETDTFGSLHNWAGDRLAANDDGDAGGHFRIVKTLAPGLYFVRVAGRGGARGPYRLTVEVSGREGAMPGSRAR